jgi:hypothetical protein
VVEVVWAVARPICKVRVLCGLNDAVGPVSTEDGDVEGLSEGLRQQVDEGGCREHTRGACM